MKNIKDQGNKLLSSLWLHAGRADQQLYKKCENLREQYREKKKYTTENRTTFQKTN
jgi:hypothetical protein